MTIQLRERERSGFVFALKWTLIHVPNQWETAARGNAKRVDLMFAIGVKIFERSEMTVMETLGYTAFGFARRNCCIVFVAYPLRALGLPFSRNPGFLRGLRSRRISRAI